VPLDARLDLPENDVLYLLQDWSQTLCVQGSFAEASSTLGKIVGPRQSEAVEAFWEEQPTPPGEEEGELLVVMADSQSPSGSQRTL